jgi:hypothetical protein
MHCFGICCRQVGARRGRAPFVDEVQGEAGECGLVPQDRDAMTTLLEPLMRA